MSAHDTEPARTPPHWARYVLVTLLLVTGGLAAAVLTRPGSDATIRLRDLLEYVAGVFALLALTEAVLSGVAAAEPLVPTRFRIVVQTTHRATTVVAVGFVTVHVLLKVTEGHASTLDAFVPFYAEHGRALYVGLGTIASDLLVLIVVTGLMRTWFAASRWPWLWRSVHLLAYAVWPLALVHGLLAGRPAKPWVVMSYLICAAVIVLAIGSRIPRLVRERRLVSERISGQHTEVPDPTAGGLEPAGPDEPFWSPSLPARMAGRPGERR